MNSVFYLGLIVRNEKLHVEGMNVQVNGELFRGCCEYGVAK